jgi:hypothetical protein
MGTKFKTLHEALSFYAASHDCICAPSTTEKACSILSGEKIMQAHIIETEGLEDELIAIVDISKTLQKLPLHFHYGMVEYGCSGVIADGVNKAVAISLELSKISRLSKHPMAKYRNHPDFKTAQDKYFHELEEVMQYRIFSKVADALHDRLAADGYVDFRVVKGSVQKSKKYGLGTKRQWDKYVSSDHATIKKSSVG